MIIVFDLAAEAAAEAEAGKACTIIRICRYAVHNEKKILEETIVLQIYIKKIFIGI